MKADFWENDEKRLKNLVLYWISSFRGKHGVLYIRKKGLLRWLVY